LRDNRRQPDRTPSVIHLTHFDPPLHGEAMMACRLRVISSSWTALRYRPINAAFTRDRDKLGKFSVGKILLMLRYLGEMVAARMRSGAGTVILHPAFHPGPFLKESVFIWTASILGMRVIAWIHMDPNRLDFAKRPAWFRWWVRTTLAQVDHIVACAPSLISTWPDWLLKRPHSAIANVIPDPVEEFSLPPRERTARPFRILYLSAIDPEKGWGELFEAARRLCDTRDDVEFHFHGGIGNSESDADVRARFAASGHPERIRWLGPVWGEEKFMCLRDADLFVFPSHTEQFPLTILEAMACSLPIVSTRVGAVADALQTPAGGCLVEPRSADALFTAINGMLAEPASLPAMGCANRERFLSSLSIETFSRQWYQLLSPDTTNT